MGFEFNAFDYFSNLLVLLVPLILFIAFVKNALARRIVLTFVGFYLLALIAPRLALAALAYWFIVWLAQLAITAHRNETYRTATMVLGVILVLSPMVLWKIYPDDVMVAMNIQGNELLWFLWPKLGELDSLRNTVIPVGLSFAAFRAADVLVQTSLGLVDRLKLGRILFFGFFPPVQVIGPIIEYREIAATAESSSKLKFPDVVEGLKRIGIGLIKIFALAAPLKFSAGIFANFQVNDAPILWLGLIIFAWYFYLNFAGYSDVAIGAARTIGFTLKENFNRPFIRTNIQDFWNNWHMSLTRLAQRDVFVPMGGYRKRMQYLAIIATIMVIALWHDFSLSLIVFGIYHAAGLCAHRAWDNRRRLRKETISLTPTVKAVKIVSVFLFVALSFPLLMLPPALLAQFYLALIGVKL